MVTNIGHWSAPADSFTRSHLSPLLDCDEEWSLFLSLWVAGLSPVQVPLLVELVPGSDVELGDSGNDHPARLWLVA